MAYGMEIYHENTSGTLVPVLFEGNPFNLAFSFAVYTPVNGTFTIPVAGITASTEISVMQCQRGNLSSFDVAHVGSGPTSKSFFVEDIRAVAGGISFDINTSGVTNSDDYHAGFYVMVTRT